MGETTLRLMKKGKKYIALRADITCKELGRYKTIDEATVDNYHPVWKMKCPNCGMLHESRDPRDSLICDECNETNLFLGRRENW